MTPTYDEIRAAAKPCEGGCGRLVTAPLPSGGYWCRDCARKAGMR